MRFISVLTLLGLVSAFFAADSARAVLYTLSIVADTTTVAPSGTFTGYDAPATSGGTAAFRASYSGGSGIFTGNGGSTTTVVKSGDVAPTSTFSGFGNRPAISGSTVSLRGLYSGSSSGMFTGSGGPLTTIAKPGDAAPIGTFSSVNDGAISGSTVAFGGFDGGGGGIFTRSGGPVTTIARAGSPAPSGTFNGFSDPAINGSRAAFKGTYSASTQSGIFTGNGGALTTIAKTGDVAPSGTFTFIDEPAISGSTVAFRGAYSGGEGVFTGSGGALTTIVKTGDPMPSGTFSGTNVVSFDGSIVAFLGFFNSFSQFGIFTASGGVITTVIKKGDPLFGSTITGLDFSRFGLDPSGNGNLAFRYNLANGRSGIAIASTAAIPESRAWLMMGVVSVGAISVGFLRRRWQTLAPVPESIAECDSTGTQLQ